MDPAYPIIMDSALSILRKPDSLTRRSTQGDSLGVFGGIRDWEFHLTSIDFFCHLLSVLLRSGKRTFTCSVMPKLFIFSGLPGTGKTTLSQRLAQHTGAVHLRIDTIEQALRDLCKLDVQAEGYGLAYRVASDNLRLGLHVVADSCNPIDLTRQE